MSSLRQQQIIQKAIKLISEHSIEGMTISNLASEVGVTEPALYRHFKNKSGIMASVLDDVQSTVHSLLEASCEERDDALDQLELFYARLFLLFSKEPAYAAVIFSEEYFLGDKQLSGKVDAILESMYAQIYSVLRHSNNPAVKRKAQHLTTIVMGTFRMIVKRWHISKHRFGLVREGDRTWATLRLMMETSNTTMHERAR